jgi:SAM-dependent methyltransferase
MRNTPVTENWFATAFDALYPVLYAHRTVEAAGPEARFAAERLGICPCDRVLDLACGSGRHIVHLLQHSSFVVGLDYSPDLLRIAREETLGKSLLVRGDMRRLPFTDQFDFLVNFFTSFGYFASEEDNAAVAQQMARALKQGGGFLIDHANLPNVRETLIPHSERQAEDLTIQEDRWLDEISLRVNKLTRVVREDVLIAETRESVQLYAPETLCALLSSAGLATDAIYGDYDGAAIDADQPRMILLGHKE